MAGPGEFDLIARLAPFMALGGDDVVVGHGDDAAVIDLDGRGVCLAVDVLVDEVHFRRDLSSLADVGWKAVAVNCSDMAAMGAVPSAAVVGLCRPAGVSAEDIEQLYAGMQQACQRWGLRLVGGDTVSAGALAVSVTVLGEVAVDAAVRRSGARAGDQLVVVGTLGAASAALAQHAAGVAPDERLLEAHRRPIAYVEQGIALGRAGATAMIDVSDGLGQDLGHICTASGVGAVVEASALPAAPGVIEAALALGRDPLAFIAGGGDDYALLAAVPAEAVPAVVNELDAVVIGRVVAGDGPLLHKVDGSVEDMAAMGWDHYREDDV